MNDKLIAEARAYLADKQPEITSDGLFKYTPFYIDLVNDLCNALEEAEKQIPKWIPVDEDSDELPYDDGSQQDVLCYFADGEIQTFNLYEIREWNKSRRDTGKNGDVATHYMPLPKGAEDKE